MAGVSHQIDGVGQAREPAPQHGQHITHGHHQAVMAAAAAQEQEPAEHMAQLALQQLAEATGQAGVAEAASAAAAGAPEHRHAPLAIGAAVAHQGQGLNRDSPLHQLGSYQGTTEVFPVAIAE
jgi:hypothetical protein